MALAKIVKVMFSYINFHQASEWFDPMLVQAFNEGVLFGREEGVIVSQGAAKQ